MEVVVVVVERKLQGGWTRSLATARRDVRVRMRFRGNGLDEWDEYRMNERMDGCTRNWIAAQPDTLHAELGQRQTVSA